MKSILFPLPLLSALASPVRRYLASRPMLAVAAALGLILGGPAYGKVESPSQPDGMLGVVRASAPTQLLPKIMQIARQVQPGPQTEALPFILGGLLGDPMLTGISATENIGMVLLGDVVNMVPVILLKLPETSPLRRTLPGFGMTLEDRFGWTFLVPTGYSLSVIDGREERLIAAVREPRRYDLEMEGRMESLVTLLRQGSGFAALGGLSGPAGWASGLEVAASELEAVQDVRIGLNLAGRAIDQGILVRAVSGTAMSSFLHQERTGDLGFARFIEADGAIGYLGGFDRAATLGYFDHLVARLAASEAGDGSAMLTDVLESTRKSLGTMSGTSAGVVSLDGMNPRMASIMPTTMGDEALQEFLRKQAGRAKGLMDGALDDTVTYVVTTHVAQVGGVDVHRLRTEWTVSDDDQGLLGAGAGLGSSGIEPQDLYGGLAEGYLATASSLDRVTRLIQAIQGGEAVENNLLSLISIRDENLFEFQMDLVQYLGEAIAWVMPGMVADLERLQSQPPPPVKGWVAARGGEGEMMASLPVETIIMLYQALVAGQQR
jgi:hypothetical protein